MTQEFTERQVQLIDYLKAAVAKGLVFFKAKHIASDLGVPPREVGANLSILSHEYQELMIEKWGYSGTSTTWKVTEGTAA